MTDNPTDNAMPVNVQIVQRLAEYFVQLMGEGFTPLDVASHMVDVGTAVGAKEIGPRFWALCLHGLADRVNDEANRMDAAAAAAVVVVPNVLN